MVGKKELENVHSAMKYFVEDNKLVLISTFLEGLPSKVSKKFSMLQSLVAPVITLAASIWIDSS